MFEGAALFGEVGGLLPVGFTVEYPVEVGFLEPSRRSARSPWESGWAD